MLGAVPSSNLFGGFAIAALVAALSVPGVRVLALRLGVVDHPSHTRFSRVPTPLLGGVAIYLAFLCGLALPPRSQLLHAGLGVLAGSTCVALAGLLDDRRRMSAPAKLAAQLVAVAMLVASGSAVALPLPAALNLALTVLWVLAVTNAMNLLDNMDGLAGGAGAIAAGSLALLAARTGDTALAATGAALCGGCLGFWLHNRSPARIFMGDAGSLLVGFLLAALAIQLRFPGLPPTESWAIPVLVLALPLLDTAFVLATRTLAGRNPFTSGGTDHLSHRLVRLGFAPEAAVRALLLGSVSAAGVAQLASLSLGLPAPGWLAAIAVFGLAFAVWLARAGDREPACANASS